MTEQPADVELDKTTSDEAIQPIEPPRPARSPLVLPAVAVVLALALLGAYLYLRAPSRPPASTAAARTDPPQPSRGAEPAEEVALPPLDDSDTFVRQLVDRVSSHPVVAAWLTTEGLIQNFAVVTSRIANGESPTNELRAVGPVPRFRPRTMRDDLFIDPASYQRYNRYAEAVSALDARGTARLYTTLKPRINEAYRRMGGTSDFDPVLERAIVEMLRVPAVEGQIELAPTGIVYGFADPKLEGLSTSQKHLLRMGPQNVRAIQAKLREIADYLAIPAARLPAAR
jgi:hypothetical protein